MGLAICKKRGEQTSTLLSPIAFQTFYNGQSPEDIYRVYEIIGGNDEWGQSFFVKKEELVALGSFFSRIVLEDKLDLYDQFVSTLTPICSKCVADWMCCKTIEVDSIRLIIE